MNHQPDAFLRHPLAVVPSQFLAVPTHQFANFPESRMDASGDRAEYRTAAKILLRGPEHWQLNSALFEPHSNTSLRARAALPSVDASRKLVVA